MSTAQYQTPWLQDIDAAIFDLNNLGVIRFNEHLGAAGPICAIGNEEGTLHLLSDHGGSINIESWGNGRVMISTDSIRRAVVHQGGNVGIGPSMNPSYKLDVQGDCNIGAGFVYRIGGVPLTLTSFGGVPATRQIIAGDGLGGGGSLAADVTLTADVITINGQVGNVVLTPGSLGVVQGHVIQDEGADRAHRAALNFVGDGVAVTDDPANNRSQVTITGGGAGSQTPWLTDIDANNHALFNLLELNVKGAAGTDRRIWFVDSTGMARWTVNANWEPETGSNSGSNFVIARYRDTGGWLGTPLIINRATGNVGIGLEEPAAPGYRLDLSGDCNISGTYRVNGVPFSSGQNQTPWLSNIDGGGFRLTNAGNITITAFAQAGSTEYLAQHGIFFRAGFDGTNADEGQRRNVSITTGKGTGNMGDALELNGFQYISFFSGGIAERMRITSTGNVGIGTATVPLCPTAAGRVYLSVVGSTSLGCVEMATTAADVDAKQIGQIVFTNGTSTHPADKRVAVITVIGEGPTAGNRGAFMTFGTHADGDAAVGALERMRITNTGAIGIGSPAPLDRVHIATADATGWGLRIVNSSSQYIRVAWNQIAAFDTGGTGAAFYLQYPHAGNLLLCMGGGLVGIGQDPPAYKLDVTGNGNFTGKVMFRNNSAAHYAGGGIEVQCASPRIGFHWPSVVASQIGMDSGGTITCYDNPGTGYANFRCENLYVNSGASITGNITAGSYHGSTMQGTEAYPTASQIMRCGSDGLTRLTDTWTTGNVHTGSLFLAGHVNTPANVITSETVTHVAVQHSSDNWIRWQTKAAFNSQLAPPWTGVTGKPVWMNPGTLTYAATNYAAGYNEPLPSGFYDGANCPGAPLGSTAWSGVIVCSHSNTSVWGWQIGIDNWQAGETARFAFRSRDINNAWASWKQVFINNSVGDFVLTGVLTHFYNGGNAGHHIVGGAGTNAGLGLLRVSAQNVNATNLLCCFESSGAVRFQIAANGTIWMAPAGGPLKVLSVDGNGFVKAT